MARENDTSRRYNRGRNEAPRRKRYHQTEMDRRHESEGMRRHDSHNRGNRMMGGKYHQSEMDRRHESAGMRRHERDYHREGMDDNYMGMISEDRHAPSNLPQHVVHHYYPHTKYIDRYELDDTIKGIDESYDDSIRIVDHYASDSMY